VIRLRSSGLILTTPASLANATGHAVSRRNLIEHKKPPGTNGTSAAG
jgi:hypothetical protein